MQEAMDAAKSHQDDKEVCIAALQLTTLIYTTPDPKTLATLQAMKRTFFSPSTAATLDAQINMFLSDQPSRPPIPRLETLIGECTQPEVKQLTESDIKDNQARLSLPKAFVRGSIKPLLKPDEDFKEGIPVTAYDSDGEEFKMNLKLWANEKVYVLTAGWKAFKTAHGLRRHEDFVTVWVFRKLDTEKLCIAITSRRFPVYCPMKRSRLQG